MLQIQKWKIMLIILAVVLGIAYAVPNMLSQDQLAAVQARLPGWMPTKTVNLGLDLRGGSHLLLEVDTKAVVRERIESMVDAARTEMRKEDIGYTDLTSSREGMSFTLRNPDKDRDAAYRIVRNLDQNAQVSVGGDGKASVVLGEIGMREINTQVVNQSIEIVRRRVDESGTKEPLIQRQGENRIVVQLPGVDDPEHIKNLLGKTAKMTFHLLDFEAMGGRASPGAETLRMRDDPTQTITIKKRVMVSGDMLTDAQPSLGQSAEGPMVSFRFNAIGGKRFCDVTKDNIGKPFAIVLDNEVISAPVIRDAICGGSGQISGSFTIKEANDLALLLRAGALPAPLNIVEERSVGPTLGADSIAAGKKACVMALLFVVAMACIVYGLFGIFASVALTINMILIIAVMSMLQATLTLPGIAGIVLTIGLAIDANVLVFERIKEELRAGRSVMQALDIGYTRAMTTIIDSNLAALISALILFSFGTGPIKGFAVTMCIGVVTSYFSAIMLTRAIIMTWVRWKKPKQIEA